MSDVTDRMLYLQSAEVHAAVHAIADIAERRLNREELFAELIRFFARYDRMRTDQIEFLKAQLTEALQWSAKPMERVI